MKIYLFLILLLSVSLCYSKGGINKVVSSLADYQILYSGFSNDGSEATMEATSQAIFLSSFFGQRNKIDVAGVSEFLKKVNNEDNGYANRNGEQSQLTAVKNALLTLTNLGLPTASNDLKGYILSLYDQNKGLFANGQGKVANLKSTAVALQCLEQLNSLSSASLSAIKQTLSGMVKTQGSVSSFSGDVVENYYGIVIGSLVGFEFDNVANWGKFFTDKQSHSGPYKGAFLNNGVASVEATESAVSALAILSTAENNLLDKVNKKDLVNYLESLPKNLAVAASAFKTIANVGLFEEIFVTRVVYENLQDTYSVVTDRITQGLQMKPKLSVRTPSGLAHDGLDVSVHITNNNGEKKTIKLPWDAESQYYAGNEFYNAETLGDVTFTFDVKWLVADLSSELQYTLTEEKTVGYKVRVTSEAEIAGKNVLEGGDIGFGTEFNFKLALETTKQRNLLKGNFVVDFTVKDSSGQAISTSSVDCSDNATPIQFSFTLEKLNIPAGNVVFSFGIKEKGSNSYHTVKEIKYNLVMKMIATKIDFPKKSFKLGDALTVKMSPASFPDLSTVTPLTATKGSFRKFNLDVIAEGSVVKTVEGVATPNLVKKEINQEVTNEDGSKKIVKKEVLVEDGSLTYTFKVTIDSTFDSLGKHTVLFRYVPQYGESLYLENYDDEAEELYTEGQELSYKVEAVPTIVQVSGSLKAGELKYGNNVKLSFKVQDSVSKKFIFPESSQYTVFLRLKHKDENGAYFIGASQPATVVYKGSSPDFFSFDWNVNPNIVKGEGELELIVQTPEGPVTLKGENKKEWKVVVNIGGDVEVSAKSHSGEIDEMKTVFTVQLGLSCDNVQLNGANLIAVVSKNSQQILVSPVSVGTGSGNYELSWVLSNKVAESGVYTVDYYRQVDAARSEGFEQIKPFFSTQLTHEKKVQERGIVPTQFLVLLCLIGSFGYMSWKKMKIESLRK